MKRFGMRRIARYGGAAGILVVVAIAIAMAAATAEATPSAKIYTTAFSPQFAAAGSTGQTYTLTLTNCAVGVNGCSKTSNQPLGSANYAIPAAYQGHITIVGTSSPGGTSWNTQFSPDNTTLQLRSATSKDGLVPGASVIVTLLIDAPTNPGTAFCSTDDWVWHSRVKQSNDFSGTGNDFSRVGGDATLTDAKLVFATAGSPPTEVQLTDTFSATVTAEDACGHTLASAAGMSVTLNPLVDPSGVGANLTGASLPSQLINASGVATFTGLSIDQVGTLFKLSASATNFADGTSDTIAVVNMLCQAHHPCSQTNGDQLITATAQTPTGGEVGIGFTSASSYVGSFTCGTSTTPIDNQLVLVDPSPNAYNGGNYTLTLLYDKSITGTGPASSFPVCLSDDGVTWPVPPNPLQACASPAVTPCVSSQKRTTSGALQIILLLGPGDPYPGGGH